MNNKQQQRTNSSYMCIRYLTIFEIWSCYYIFLCWNPLLIFVLHSRPILHPYRPHIVHFLFPFGYVHIIASICILQIKKVNRKMANPVRLEKIFTSTVLITQLVHCTVYSCQPWTFLKQCYVRLIWICLVAFVPLRFPSNNNKNKIHTANREYSMSFDSTFWGVCIWRHRDKNRTHFCWESKRSTFFDSVVNDTYNQYRSSMTLGADRQEMTRRSNRQS